MSENKLLGLKIKWSVIVKSQIPNREPLRVGSQPLMPVFKVKNKDPTDSVVHIMVV